MLVPAAILLGLGFAGLAHYVQTKDRDATKSKKDAADKQTKDRDADVAAKIDAARKEGEAAGKATAEREYKDRELERLRHQKGA